MELEDLQQVARDVVKTAGLRADPYGDGGIEFARRVDLRQRRVGAVFPGNTGASSAPIHGRSSADSTITVTGLSSAPAGIETPACPCVVTMVVVAPGWAVPSPHSESTCSHCEPTPIKNGMGMV